MPCIRCVAALALLALAVQTTVSAGAAEAQPMREVLPDAVLPVRYDLALAPNAEALTFRGKVAITVEVRAATPQHRAQRCRPGVRACSHRWGR